MDTTGQHSAASAAEEEADARRRLGSLPGFSLKSARAAHLTRLVGMTNRVYEVEAGDRHYCLRIPGSGTAAPIDRRAEEANSRAAAEAGIAPEVLFFGEDGVMLTRFVENAVPLGQERLRTSECALERGAAVLRRLHEADIVFVGTFQAFTKIDEYAAALKRLGRPPSDADRATIDGARKIRSALAAHPTPARPCHCDPTGRNLLDTGERVWLVDWEYSGMNDPMWDLAYFSVESELDAAGDSRLLTTYFGREPEPAEAARVAVLKPVCEVLTALWALIQVAESADGGDFAGYAKATFERAAERMRLPDFAGHLERLRAG